MIRSTIAGIAYFGIVFPLAFLLGTIRVLVVAPAMGSFGAVLVETPFVLAVSWVACGWLTQGQTPLSGLGARLWMGTVAFLVLEATEAVLGVYGFGLGWAAQVAALAQPTGMLGLAGQIIFALIPSVRLQWRPQGGDWRG
jgi:hypothetical protein